MSLSRNNSGSTNLGKQRADNLKGANRKRSSKVTSRSANSKATFHSNSFHSHTFEPLQSWSPIEDGVIVSTNVDNKNAAPIASPSRLHQQLLQIRQRTQQLEWQLAYEEHRLVTELEHDQQEAGQVEHQIDSVKVQRKQKQQRKKKQKKKQKHMNNRERECAEHSVASQLGHHQTLPDKELEYQQRLQWQREATARRKQERQEQLRQQREKRRERLQQKRALERLRQQELEREQVAMMEKLEVKEVEQWLFSIDPNLDHYALVLVGLCKDAQQNSPNCGVYNSANQLLPSSSSSSSSFSSLASSSSPPLSISLWHSIGIKTVQVLQDWELRNPKALEAALDQLEQQSPARHHQAGAEVMRMKRPHRYRIMMELRKLNSGARAKLQADAAKEDRERQQRELEASRIEELEKELWWEWVQDIHANTPVSNT
jgi:hypothetical protein